MSYSRQSHAEEHTMGDIALHKLGRPVGGAKSTDWIQAQQSISDQEIRNYLKHFFIDLRSHEDPSSGR